MTIETVPHIRKPDPVAVWRWARKIAIVDHISGTTRDWVPYHEQFDIWRQLAENQFAFVLKVRQIGATTAVLLDDLIWCLVNDESGHKVKCGLFIDTDAKADEQFDRAKHMLDQMGAAYTTRKTNIVFPNGSMMHFATAGGKRAGASISFQRLHLTELPFWRDATNSFSSIMQTLGMTGQCIIETTMGLEDPVAMTLWKKKNQFKKIFYSYEDHRFYRAPEDNWVDFPMTEEEREWLIEEGFTDELSMRHWLWHLRNKNANDKHKNFREYPQKPEHSFMYAEGRWCNVDPVVLDPLRVETWDDVPGELEIFREPEHCSHHLFIGVDTAGGRGQDRSVAVVIDGLDNHIVACFVNADIRIFEHAKVVQRVQKMYTRPHLTNNGSRTFRPLALVEENAIGLGIIEELTRLRVKIQSFKTTEASKQRFLELTARYILEGACYGPFDLEVEAGDVRLKNGKFIGLKDLFMACGFCYDWLENSRYRELPKPRPRNVLSRDAILRRGR